MAQRTVKLGSFAPGVNNRLEPTKLATALPDRSWGTYLYAAENVDITQNGFLKRRRGVTKRIDAVVAHSVWGDGAPDGYAVVDGDLVRLTRAGDALTTAVVRSGMLAGAVSFVRMPDGGVYWSNDQEIGRIVGLDALQLAPRPPSTTPAVAVTTGALPAGRYQFAFTTVTADGESPATEPFAVEAGPNSGFNFSWTSSDMKVYMTGPDGDVFNEVDAGPIFSLSNLGARCATLFMANMPAGRILRHYAGSLLSAKSNVLYVSETYRYGLYNPQRGYIPFPAPITVVEPCDDGVYVCADKTYWLPGDIMDTTANIVLPYGGLIGSGGFDDKTTQAFWQGPQGVVIGQPGGKVEPIQANALDFGPAASGASLYREYDGMNHIITARQEAGVATTAARSYLANEVTRKEPLP